MKKFIFGIFTGFIFFYICFFPYETEIGTEISPNGKYKLIYSATRYGLSYRHYIEVKKVSTDEHVFLEFIDSDDIKNPHNDAHWNGDTIVVPKGSITDRTDLPYKTVTTMGKMTFYFKKGFATE